MTNFPMVLPHPESILPRVRSGGSRCSLVGYGGPLQLARMSWHANCLRYSLAADLETEG
jgi:hypothetical protein